MRETFITLLAIICMAVVISMPAQAQEPDTLDALSTRVVEAIATQAANTDDMNQFRRQAQNWLDEQDLPQIPTAVPNGNLRRTRQCLVNQYGVVRCRFMIQTGR